MKRPIIFLFVLSVIAAPAWSQVILTEPAFPTEGDSVTILFDASQGNAGLINYTGDIWAHTGVITNKSTSPTDWKYVIAGWSVNTDKAKLVPLGNNLWRLRIGPSIRAYYGVPDTETILKMAFVFRNATGTKTGRNADGSDIFALVYEAGLNVSFIKPPQPFVAVDPGSVLPVEAAATGSDSIALYRDGVRITGNSGNSLTYSLQVESGGFHRVEARAYGGDSVALDSFSYLVRSDLVTEDLPAGAIDGINYPDDHSAILVLFAPGKEFAFLLGDFNGWTIDESFLMRKTPDGQRFWIRIDTLQKGREYRFQYLVDGVIRIADPYADKLLDPANDSGIDSITYPDLISYPAGLTTEIVSVLQPGQDPYPWKIQAFIPPAPDTLIIYELLMRDFLDAHSFAALKDTLGYIKSLGVNAIELMPVNEFEGNDSWGYNPSFYFAVDKYYGPKNTFKALVDAAHETGLAVILDMVLNHSYGSSPMVRLYWDAANNRPAADNPWYNTASPNPVYSYGYDFNQESPATQRFVDSVNAYWLKEYHIDGYRFDFTKGFTNTPGEGSAYDSSRIAILERMAAKIWQVKPDAPVILEHFTANAEEMELSDFGMLLWGNLNYNYRQASSGWYSGGGWDFSGISYRYRGWDLPHLDGYMESHDEERLMYDCVHAGNTQNPSYPIRDLPVALKRMEMAANFLIPVPGPKMIWMFGELGYDYSINYNGRLGRKPIRWDYYGVSARKRLYQVYASLNRLKREEPMFSTSDFTVALMDSVKQIHLNHPSMNGVILGNFGVRPSWTDPAFPHEGWWYELWSGDSLLVTDVDARMSFQPGEYRFYTDHRLVKPDIISSSAPQPSFREEAILRLFPNPAADRLFVTLDGEPGMHPFIRIIDLQGREIRRYSGVDIKLGCDIELNISDLDSGVYFLEWRDSRRAKVVPWIKKP